VIIPFVGLGSTWKLAIIVAASLFAAAVISLIPGFGAGVVLFSIFVLLADWAAHVLAVKTKRSRSRGVIT